MEKEVNLLSNYPKSKRDISKREDEKTEKDRNIARKFGKDFFDGNRKHGYGGFSYNPKYWQVVVQDFKKYWNLSSSSSILDVGCAKGFMLYDFSIMSRASPYLFFLIESPLFTHARKVFSRDNFLS